MSHETNNNQEKKKEEEEEEGEQQLLQPLPNPRRSNRQLEKKEEKKVTEVIEQQQRIPLRHQWRGGRRRGRQKTTHTPSRRNLKRSQLAYAKKIKIASSALEVFQGSLLRLLERALYLTIVHAVHERRTTANIKHLNRALSAFNYPHIFPWKHPDTNKFK